MLDSIKPQRNIFIVSLLKSNKNNYLFLFLKQLYLNLIYYIHLKIIMKNIVKYLKQIDSSLDMLLKNKELVQNAKENINTINKLEEEIKKNKNIKLESIELIEQTMIEIEKLISDSPEKEK